MRLAGGTCDSGAESRRPGGRHTRGVGRRRRRDGPPGRPRRTGRRLEGDDHQDSPGVPDSSGPGDDFGASTAWGDVDGDGHADLAIGRPYDQESGGAAGARSPWSAAVRRPGSPPPL
ncbi:FG-GAP repeat protein [Streptomyces sp. NPDC001292]|uniref:FG-GAP repeat protein n=1 Tax=Streptomyces sp. NPDC001292 TaxID=3364558 RepID=UPI0036AE78AC